MISTSTTNRRRIPPRLRLFGLVPSRDLRPDAPARVSIPGPELAQPRDLLPETWHLNFADGCRIEPFSSTSAHSLLIGWFNEKPISARGQGTAENGSTDAGVAALPPRDLTALRLAAVLQPPLEALLDPNSVLDWPHPFHSFQRHGIETLLARRELLLADDMGLGKTIQAIAALRILFHKSSITTALVVCPASLVAQWMRELNTWAGDLKVIRVAGSGQERGLQWSLPAHIKIVSYDTLRGDVLDVRDSQALKSTWSVVVLDEASRIKNRETGISIACKKLPRDRRWALTGTPLENRVEDVESIIEFLLGDPGSRLPAVRGGRSLRAVLSELQLRRKKDHVLKELPAKQIIEQAIELLPGQRRAYDRAEQEGIVELERAGPAITVTHVLELISRLKQICNSDPATGESAKIDDIESRLGTLVDEGHRALVFSQFTDSRFGVAHMAHRLERFAPLVYTGAMSAGRKDAAVAAFTSDDRHKALILSLRAGGVGLNLQAASYVFHLDRWWNPAIEEQAESRSHRMGQMFPVTVFRYVCIGTIEERIDAKLKAKRQLFSEVVDDVSLDISSALSEEELYGLFGLHPPQKSSAPQAPAMVEFAELAGEQFEAWLAAALKRLGFHVEVTAGHRDGGVDIVASKFDELRIESKLLIQCKNQREPMGISALRELRGVTPARTAGVTAVAASPRGFTADAGAFARSNGILLWDEATLRQVQQQANAVSHSIDHMG